MKRAAIAVIRRGDLFLTVSRRHDLHDMGFPGGKCEEDETVEEGLIREVYEETGIRIREFSSLITRSGFEHEVSVFLIHSWDGEPESREGTRIAWMTAETLATQRTFGEFNRGVTEILKVNENQNTR